MQPKDLEKLFRILRYIILENKENAGESTLQKSKSYDYTQSKGNNAENKKERLKLLFGVLIISVALTSLVTLLVMTIVV